MTRSNISPEALAAIGGGKIAYVKAIRSEDLNTLFPQAPRLAPGLQLFALHAADGTPIMVADTREAAVANACDHELETVSVHRPENHPVIPPESGRPSSHIGQSVYRVPRMRGA